MSELLLAAQVDFDRPRRCPGSIPVDRNKGLRYPADPPKVEQIVAVMRAAGDDAHGRRLRGLIVILWRAGLRIQKRSRFPRPISISAAAPCSSAGRGRRASRGRHGRGGCNGCSRGSNCGSRYPSGRCSPLSPVRCADLVERCRASGLPHDRRRRRGPAALHAPPAAARPCRRADARRHPADRHPAPTRPHQPPRHVGLPAGHRQRGNHRDRPCPPPADDASEHISTAVIRGWRDAAYRALRHRRHSAYGGGNPAPSRAPSGSAKAWTRTTRPSRTVKSDD
jgi:hypothetical protein